MPSRASWADALAESKRLLGFALPACGEKVLSRLLTVISISFVGHVCPPGTSLAGCALANTIGNVLGNSICVGLSGAITTLAAQASGAKDYKATSVTLQTGALVLGATCAILSLVWLRIGSLLLLAGQDAGVALAAQRYLLCLIPGLWGFGAMQVINSWLQAQRLMRPAVYAAVVAIPVSVSLHILLMVKPLQLGFLGAALATSMTLCVQTGVMGAFLVQSAAFKRAWTGWDLRATLAHLNDYLGLALPSLGMLAEWWSSEANILLGGVLRPAMCASPWMCHPEVAVAGMSIYQTTNAVCFMLPLGVAIAAGTRVGNELGAGEGGAAQLAARCSLILALAVSGTMGLAIFFGRATLPALFTDDAAVEPLVSRLYMLLAAYVVLDGLAASASGSVRGAGIQHIAARLVLVGYYVFGLPIGAALAFKLKLGPMGLVTGALCGKLIHTLGMIFLVLVHTDFDACAAKASLRYAAPAKDVELAVPKPAAKPARREAEEEEEEEEGSPESEAVRLLPIHSDG